MVQPTTLNLGRTIKGRNVIGGEEGCADVTDESTNSMHGKDIKSVVDAQDELELGRIVGKAGTQNAENDSRPNRNIAFARLVHKDHGGFHIRVDLPEPGVMETRPATTPEQKPTVDHFFSKR